MSGQPTVSDYMTTSPHTIGVDQSVATAIGRMREHRIRHLPVLDGGTLVGVLSDRDVSLAADLRQGLEDVAIEEVMSGEPYTVEPSTPLVQVAAAIAERGIGSAVVTTRGAVVAMITASDLARALVEQLSE